jgi:hypothetical protein
MKECIETLNQMVEAGVILRYAIFGAVAQMRYTDAVATADADILVALPDESPLDVLGPIYKFCEAKGFKPTGDAIQIGDWPVQFIPCFDSLSREALETAEETEVDGSHTRVVSALFLALMALKTGRVKDHLRVVSLLEVHAITPEELAAAADSRGLSDKWNQFQRKTT